MGKSKVSSGPRWARNSSKQGGLSEGMIKWALVVAAVGLLAYGYLYLQSVLFESPEVPTSPKRVAKRAPVDQGLAVPDGFREKLLTDEEIYEFVKTGDHATAMKELNRRLTYFPDAAGYNNLGLLLLDAGDAKAAHEAFVKANGMPMSAQQKEIIEANLRRSRVALGGGVRYTWHGSKNSPTYADGDAITPNGETPPHVKHPDAPEASQLFDAHNFAAAGRVYERIVRDYPEDVVVLNNLAVCQFKTGFRQSGLELMKRATKLKPLDPDLLLTAAYGLNLKREDTEHAVQFLRRALELRPGHLPTMSSLASSLYLCGTWKYRNIASGHIEEAIGLWQRMIELEPDPTVSAYTRLSLFEAYQFIGDWDNGQPLLPSILAANDRVLRPLIYRIDEDGADAVMDQKMVFSLFSGLHLPEVPDASLVSAARITSQEVLNDAQRILPPTLSFAHIDPRTRGHKRIRVGYLSGNFGTQPTGRLMQGVFRLHDKKRFDVYCYATAPPDDSPERARIGRECHHFVDAYVLPPDALATRISSDEIDILVDLDSHLSGGTPHALTRFPAPINVHLIGYPHSTGSTFHHYFIADKVVAPPESRSLFTEKLVYLPHTFFINSYMSGFDPLKHEPHSLTHWGVPVNVSGDAFVFACFNIFRKVTPGVFDSWMRILQRVPNSVLWLLPPGSGHAVVRERARRLGVDPDRLVFAGGFLTNHTDHLLRYRSVHVLLDTAPYGAHTTAADALWAGVPVVTVLDKPRMASRVAGSLLTALEMPELITPSWAIYEDLAVRLGTDRAF
eukprot:TRINITY_DN8074_c0_g1_i3.p1 TRINITY_DN8074_c0_g1~~TRINITY_DN8074_c0_g1_i3.p1  ORF type:complete len:788 (-),score=255.24 TRINITY_DN8074_c0_g1_i3:381-2744(-)